MRLCGGSVLYLFVALLSRQYKRCDITYSQLCLNPDTPRFPNKIKYGLSEGAWIFDLTSI